MKKLFILLIPFIFIFAACSNSTASDKGTTQSSEEVLTVYTTVYPLQYFTERIGGDLVDVKTVYPPGSDEHTYEPSQKDMIKMADSDLFIYLGLGLEGFVDQAKDILSNEGVKMIAAGEHLAIENTEQHEHDDHEHEHEHEHDHDGHDHGDVDPHVWIDPVYGQQLAEEIKTQLITALPEHEEEFTANFDQLNEELNKLNDKFTSMVENADKNKFIVSHAAYGYWESRYGLEQISVAGLSTSSEPSQKQLQNIIQTANENTLDTIYFEQNVSSKLTEIVQSEIGAESLQLHNLAVLTEADINEGENYFTLMERNIDNLEKGLN
ncbi:metal ABC transporter solute-binding protein, Zn/Mn family [Cytobacillus kochii]|uniref:metal ABC transporter solute-binding protein, Zn/Mn family n=1 Tax=Cytobacillus kochii TaxID=859143 RepID=UPI00203ABEEA|nr:zinc ABC transporter substrate-binding protein [Cytobacillus kochii]MCM3322939.1 zinc ABC transporter substrate-binding protein [Cytobacillus kochii]MCM3345335.1 zinc ABC transporter substrate-binding protein [Cytobacillus kochii]